MVDERARSAIQRLLDELVASGAEVGLQVAVIHDGRVVVDAASGVADAATGEAVAADTLFYAASTAKGVASTVAHALVARGELDYDVRAVDVWPEFGVHGKEQVTLRHVLLHTAGVPGLPAETTLTDLCDWDRMCATIADAEPWWEPGTRFGYHALTFGFLIGEILRRATGRTISELLRELVTEPLGVQDDIHFAVPPTLLSRVARQVGSDAAVPPPPAPGTPLERAIPPGVRIDAAMANRTDVLSAAIPSAGTMTARGAARIYSALLGQVDGIELVSPQQLSEMAAITYRGIDEVMGFETQWAFGYSPYRPAGDADREGSTFGMVGANGSAAYADMRSGVAVALMRNRFTAGDLTALERVDRIVVANFS